MAVVRRFWVGVLHREEVVALLGVVARPGEQVGISGKFLDHELAGHSGVPACPRGHYVDPAQGAQFLTRNSDVFETN